MLLKDFFYRIFRAGVFGGSLFSAMHGSLVTSSLIRETTENESANEGYKFGQEENKESPSSGERTGKSPALNPTGECPPGHVAFGRVR